MTSAFYPELSPRSFRASELAKEFYRQGHNVTVISKYRSFDYTQFLGEYKIDFKMWGKAKFPQIPKFTNRRLVFISKILKRFAALLFEYPAIEEMFQVKNILRQESGYDMLISFAVPYPVHWGVASIIEKKNRPIAQIWVADCGDPYMFSRLDTFRKPFYFKFLEHKFCSKCDFISVPFHNMKFQFYSKYFNKIKVIPQGFNFREIRLYDDEVNNDKPIFIFAGSIIPGKRDLSSFLIFLSTITTDFTFIVYTNQFDLLTKYKLLLGDKLVLRHYIDRLSLIYEMSKADFVVNVDTIHDNLDNVEAIPSKLIDYSISGRPILNINSANLDNKLIMEFLSKDYSRQRRIQKSDFDITKIAHQFLELTREA